MGIFKKETVSFIKKEEVVSCSNCGCLLELRYAQTIKDNYSCVFNKYYCRSHRKPYNRIQSGFIVGAYRYFGEVEMDKDGNIVT